MRQEGMNESGPPWYLHSDVSHQFLAIVCEQPVQMNLVTRQCSPTVDEPDELVLAESGVYIVWRDARVLGVELSQHSYETCWGVVLYLQRHRLVKSNNVIPNGTPLDIPR